MPGKLAFHRIPVADVVAFTVYQPAPEPQRQMGRLRFALALVVFAVTIVPRFVFAVLAGRLDGTLPPPPAVTDEDPPWVPIRAWVLLERDDADLVDRVRVSIDAALRRLPGFADIDFVLPPGTPADVIDVTVPLRAPNGPDRYAAESAAIDVVVEAFPARDTLPGVELTEISMADL